MKMVSEAPETSVLAESPRVVKPLRNSVFGSDSCVSVSCRGRAAQLVPCDYVARVSRQHLLPQLGDLATRFPAFLAASCSVLRACDTHIDYRSRTF